MNTPTLDKVPGYNLYIGGFIALRRPKALANCHITHIVSVLDWHFEKESELIRGYEHLLIPVDDVEDEDLLTWFPRSNSFIHTAFSHAQKPNVNSSESNQDGSEGLEDLSSLGSGVLVHCAMGKSRSATIILAYLLWDSRRKSRTSHLTKTDSLALPDTVSLSPNGLTVPDALTLLRRSRPIAEPNEGFMDQLHLYYDMGCPDNVESHRLYKRWMYRRNLQESLGLGKAPEVADVRFEDEAEDDEGVRKEKAKDAERQVDSDVGDVGSGIAAPDGTVSSAPVSASRPTPTSSASSEPSTTDLKCRKCRRLLAKSSFILPHSPPATAKEPCAHIFLHPLSWMKPALSTGQLDGRLTCPNLKCGANVGKFAWQGMRCSCGDWITPGFGVGKAKVDEVKSVDVNTDSAMRARKVQPDDGFREGAVGVRAPPGIGRRGGAGNL